MPFLNSLHAEFVEGKDEIIVIKPLRYYDNRSKQLFEIPPKFRSDCTSIPQFLWSVLGHPFQHDVRKEGVLHDFLYRNALVKRIIADQMYFDALIEGGCDPVKAQILFSGVRAGGGDVYKKYKHERKGLS